VLLVALGFLALLGLIAAFRGDYVRVLAFLLSTLVVVSALALAAGFVALTREYVRAVHETLFHGRNPDVPELSTDEPAEFGYHGGPAWWDLVRTGNRVRRGTGVFALFLLPHLAVQAVVVLTHLALAWAGVVGLRLVDGGLLRYRRIRMMCLRCFEHLAYPSYECGGCGRVDRDVRPGRRGVFRRGCVCGQALPTLLMLGSAELSALCPNCEQGLEHRPGEARELPIALFGGTGAGKTRLTHGLHAALGYAALEHAATARHGARVEMVGEDTRQRLAGSPRMLSPRYRVRPTPPGRRARGLTLRVTAEQRVLLVQVYDTAGEWFDRSRRVEELTYLGKTTTFVLVVDPLAIPAVWKALDAGERWRLAEERSRTPDPEPVYMQVREEVARQYATLGRSLGRTRLAVVVTRGDLLAETSVAPDGVPPERWAWETLGIRNVLRAARSDFGSTEVFVTGAVVDAGGHPDPSLTALARWVLAPEAEAFTGVLAAAAAPGTAPAPAEPAEPAAPSLAVEAR
jgi:hypothetical protein